MLLHTFMFLSFFSGHKEKKTAIQIFLHLKIYLYPSCVPRSLAPWLSWLKRLSSKQEIPSSNLGGASLFFLPSFPIIPHCLHLDLSCSYCPFSACQPGQLSRQSTGLLIPGSWVRAPHWAHFLPLPQSRGGIFLLHLPTQNRQPAEIAQLGERQTEDLKVPGSIPGFGKPALLFPFPFSPRLLPILFLPLFSNSLHNDAISQHEGGLAQMVERSLSMREVPGSIPGSSMSFFHQHQIENQSFFHHSPTIGQLSGWPSGLRRCVQVAVHFCGRGFESHS